jgi:hypothetical protein
MSLSIRISTILVLLLFGSTVRSQVLSVLTCGNTNGVNVEFRNPVLLPAAVTH